MCDVSIDIEKLKETLAKKKEQEHD